MSALQDGPGVTGARSVEAAFAVDPDVQAFMRLLKFVQGGVSVREISDLLGRRREYMSSSTIWRHLTGKAFARTWRIAEKLIEVMEQASGNAVDRTEAKQLWARAHAAVVRIRRQHRADELAVHDPGVYRAIAESGTSRGVRAAVVDDPRPPFVMHDGEVMITDPAVLTGRRIEIHGGRIVLVGAAVELAGAIVVFGGKVVIGQPVIAQGDEAAAIAGNSTVLLN